MRHRLGLRKLNRTSSHRLAMLRNMTNSLLTHEVIKTTLPKAKELRRVAEPLITLGKTPTVANRRLAFARLRDRAVVVKLFDELGPRYQARPGGYLRILKSGFRKGDNAPLALVTVLGAGQVELGRWVVSAALTESFGTQGFEQAGRAYEVALRRARVYHPFAVRLNTFTHEKYPGTNTPKRFASDVTVVADGVTLRAASSASSASVSRAAGSKPASRLTPWAAALRATLQVRTCAYCT